MNYTNGNWTVSSLTTDTIATAKSISLTDVDFSNDFVKSMDEPNEGKLVNSTSTGIIPVESVRFARTEVSDIYNNIGIPGTAKFPTKSGVRVLCELVTSMKAVNSVSGDEYLIPIKAWTCVQVPSTDVISSTAVEYALKRQFAVCFDTKATSASRIVDIAKGAVLPD